MKMAKILHLVWIIPEIFYILQRYGKQLAIRIYTLKLGHLFLQPSLKDNHYKESEQNKTANDPFQFIANHDGHKSRLLPQQLHLSLPSINCI